MQNHDRERQEEEEEEAAELWRLQETLATHENKEEGESQTAITRQHEVLSITLRGGNSGRNERNQRRKGTEETQTEQTTAHSPLILQGCNSHTHRQPRFSQENKNKNITALFGFRCFFSTVSTERHTSQNIINVLKPVMGELQCGLRKSKIRGLILLFYTFPA